MTSEALNNTNTRTLPPNFELEPVDNEIPKIREDATNRSVCAVINRQMTDVNMSEYRRCTLQL